MMSILIQLLESLTWQTSPASRCTKVPRKKGGRQVIWLIFWIKLVVKKVKKMWGSEDTPFLTYQSKLYINWVVFSIHNLLLGISRHFGKFIEISFQWDGIYQMTLIEQGVCFFLIVSCLSDLKFFKRQYT